MLVSIFDCCIIFGDVLLDSRVIFGESLFLAASFYSRPRLFHCVFSLFSRCKEEGKEWLGIGLIHAASKVKERPLLSQRSVRGQIFRSESFAFVGSTVYVSMGKQLKKPDKFVKKIFQTTRVFFLPLNREYTFSCTGIFGFSIGDGGNRRSHFNSLFTYSDRS